MQDRLIKKAAPLNESPCMQWTFVAPVVLASFMASMVEFVEALTIVLAVGVVRGWRSALLGAAASLATLVILVLALGLTSPPNSTAVQNWS